MALKNGPNLGALVNGAAGEAHYAELMRQWRAIDALVQPSVISRVAAVPTTGMVDGDRYLLTSGANINKIARYSTDLPTAGWEYYTPKSGWSVWVTGDGKSYRFSGSTWAEESSGGGGGGMSNPMTTAGDIIVGGASGAPLRLPIGTEGQVAVVRSGALVYEAQAGGTVTFAPVLTESTTSRTLSVSDAGDYVRFTNAGASTCTVAPQSSVSWAAYTEIHIRRAGAGNLTLTPGAGVTLNAPSGGSLVLTAGMSVTLKRAGLDEWDVIGQTVAA